MSQRLLSRRTIIQQGALLASAALLPRYLSAQQAPAPAVVKTPLGTIRGASASMRDPDEFLKYRDYIHHNPVRGHLCQLPENYAYSSAYRSSR
jgi:hypothetical protein